MYKAMPPDLRSKPEEGQASWADERDHQVVYVRGSFVVVIGSVCRSDCLS